MLPNIIFGIGQAHPEFKMDVKRGEMTVMPAEEAKQYREIRMGAEPEEIDKMADAEPDGDPEGLFLVYTMPDVDKERRDLLTPAVKDLHADKLRDEKLQEIDDAYADYTLRQQKKTDDIPEDWDYSKGIQIDQIQQ